jgi:hypothetical protein
MADAWPRVKPVYMCEPCATLRGMSDEDIGRATWAATLDAMPQPEWHRFAHALLVDPAGGVIRFVAQFPALLAAIESVAALHLRAANGDTPAANEWEDAREATSAR